MFEHFMTQMQSLQIGFHVSTMPHWFNGVLNTSAYEQTLEVDDLP